MPIENTPPGKKHRVIAWKPEGADRDSSSDRRLPPWVTALAATGGIVLFVVAIVGGYFIWGAYQQRKQAEMAEASGSVPGESISVAFQGRSRAEFAREAAKKGFDTIRKTPSDHPSILQRLVEAQHALTVADRAFENERWAEAVKLYDAVSTRTQAFANELEDMRKAREGYNKFQTDIVRLRAFQELDPATWEAALTAAGTARQFLDEGTFTPARKSIDEASARLLSIEKSIADQLEQSLADGRTALSQGNGKAATAAFHRALELASGNDVALKGIERAKTIDAVFALNAEADGLEAKADFENAQKKFETAFAMDAQSATAQAGISRMKAAIRKRDFEASLTAATTARENKKWVEAIAGYQAALKLFPDRKDIATQLADAKVREREAHIQGSLANAYELERTYEWNGARKIYLDLLQYEPGQADAEEGLLRTGRVIRALLKFERLLEDARSHAQRANFQSSIAAFNEAMANKPSYLQLTADQDEFKSMLEKQSRPVEVAFISDGHTWVTIEGTRMLGRFDKTSVSILPGNYQVIGRRKGYEDVREVIRIRAGDSVPPVTIVAVKRT